MTVRTLVHQAVTLALVLGALLAAPSPARARGEYFVVDRSDDAAVSGCLAAVANDCTLRGAITRANASPGAQITFAVSEVLPTAPLPPITAVGTVIYGLSEGLVVINGHAMTQGPVLTVAASLVRIRYTAIINTPAGGWSADVLITGGAGIHIDHNALGVLPSSTDCKADRVIQWGSYGVLVANDLDGGPGAGNGAAYFYDNTIACHLADGVFAGKSNYLYIGVDPDGMAGANKIALNNGNGILLDGVTRSTIANNQISGSGQSGVNLLESSDNLIKSNTIGAGIGLGPVPLLNGEHGVRIVGYGSHEARDNVVGGPLSDDGNYIGGNGGSGIMLEGSAVANSILGNLIGSFGLPPVPVTNHGAGVTIRDGANGNIIGSVTDSNYQLVINNDGEGIYISNASGTLIQRNTVVASNRLQGIVVAATGGGIARGNVIRPGMVYDNGGLPIDLGGDGRTKNGTQTPPGPNDWIGYPVVTADGSSVLHGTVCPGCTVHFYYARRDPAGAGGGGIHVASLTDGDGDGQWSFAEPAPPALACTITMVACDDALGCSEMSPRPVVWLPVEMNER